jgi:hypothetical protein
MDSAYGCEDVAGVVAKAKSRAGRPELLPVVLCSLGR